MHDPIISGLTMGTYPHRNRGDAWSYGRPPWRFGRVGLDKS